MRDTETRLGMISLSINQDIIMLLQLSNNLKKTELVTNNPEYWKCFHLHMS